MTNQWNRRGFVNGVGGWAVIHRAFSARADETAAPPRVGIALLGGAHIHTPGFVQLLKQNDRVRTLWSFDPILARAERHAAELGARATTRMEDALGDPAVQAVVICSETNRHVALAEAAIRARKHLFIEKPLADNAKDAHRLATAMRAANLIFSTGFYMRANRNLIFLREQIQRGRFGRITRIHAVNGSDAALAGVFGDEYAWMTDPTQAGFGAFGDIGMHPLDIVQWWLGRPVSVSARLQCATGRYPHIDDTGTATLRYAQGTIATISAGWADQDQAVSFEISGTAAYACIHRGILSFKCPAVEGADGRRPWKQLPETGDDPLTGFLRAVTHPGEAASLVSPQAAADAVDTMEAIYRSDRTGGYVQTGYAP